MSEEINISLQTEPNYFDRTFESELKNRVIILNEAINAGVVEKIIMPILTWNAEDDASGLAIEDRKKITMYINSVGGNVTDGAVLANVIEGSVTPIEVIVLGLCASMGTFLCMAGTKGLRKCYQLSTFLIHCGSTDVSGNSNAVKSTVKYFEVLDSTMAKFLFKHTNITPAMYKKHYSEEWYFSSKDAKKLGLIDIIIGEE